MDAPAVILVNLAYPAGASSPDGLLAGCPTLAGWADAVAGEGLAVTVYQRFPRPAEFDRAAAGYRLMPDGFGPHLRLWQAPRRLNEAVAARLRQARADGRPAVVHLNGFLFPQAVRDLRRRLPAGIPLVVQHHAGAPLRGVRGWLQRRACRGVDGFLFAARDQAAEWIEAGVIPTPDRVFEVMEASTDLRPADRAAARQRTGQDGSPAVLWVGRLDDNKDPLAVLAGFARVLERRPEARLAMIYTEDPLLPAVRRRLAERPALARAVRLVGSRPHAELADWYSGADFFVLGSHHEGSGYALCEAMACGVVPVVTGIPSFRRMTGEGRAGALWPPGDAAAFARAFEAAAARPWPAESAAARRLFEERLSWPAIGRDAAAAYRQVLARRGVRS